MPHSREDVLAAIRVVFPRADVNAILATVDEYGVETYQRERERVQLAVINLSEGSAEKLRYFIEVAKRDYRDVLFWSECPEQARIDTPEKKKQMREMIKRLGFEPPNELDEA